MTVLMIGGACQGKTALARTLFGPEPPLVNGLHLLVRKALEEGQDPQALLPALREHVVLCDEVGCGVVPLDPADRTWREAVGRLCCALAQEADVVIRVTCGLPQVLKGQLSYLEGGFSHDC